MDQPAGNPGLSPEVQQALARRGGAPTPQLQQTTQGAVPPPMPDGTATSNPPAATKTQSQKYQAQNQQDMIVEALVEQLKSSNKLERDKIKLNSPATAPAPLPPLSSPTPQTQTPESYLGTPSMSTSQMQGSPFSQPF